LLFFALAQIVILTMAAKKTTLVYRKRFFVMLNLIQLLLCTPWQISKQVRQ
jgi:hypothetical protein